MLSLNVAQVAPAPLASQSSWTGWLLGVKVFSEVYCTPTDTALSLQSGVSNVPP